MFKLKSMPKCHSNTSPRRTHKYILSILNDHLVFFFYIQRLLPYDPPHIYDMWSRALSILYIRCEHAHMWFYIYLSLHMYSFPFLITAVVASRYCTHTYTRSVRWVSISQLHFSPSPARTTSNRKCIFYTYTQCII